MSVCRTQEEIAFAPGRRLKCLRLAQVVRLINGGNVAAEQGNCSKQDPDKRNRPQRITDPLWSYVFSHGACLCHRRGSLFLGRFLCGLLRSFLSSLFALCCSLRITAFGRFLLVAKNTVPVLPELRSRTSPDNRSTHCSYLLMIYVHLRTASLFCGQCPANSPSLDKS